MSRQILTVLTLSWLAAGCASTASPEISSLVAAPEQPAENATAPQLVATLRPSPEGVPVICREMLRPASNVIVRRCASPAEWRTYDRAQEEWARRTLRQMQGSRY